MTSIFIAGTLDLTLSSWQIVVVMEKLEGKLAIVTGTTSGIGKAIAIKLVEAGLRVVGLARREERGKELALSLEGKKGRFYNLTVDISKEEDVVKAFQWIEENMGPVDVLINNAGIWRETTLIDGETKLWKEVLDTNVLGLCMMTREAVKMMRANNISGQIVHIGSELGHVVLPIKEANLYPASKFAIAALTETLRQELNQIGSQIKISCVSPGLVDTEICDYSEELKEAISLVVPLQSEDIADVVLFVLTRPSHVQIHDILLRSIHVNRW